MVNGGDHFLVRFEDRMLWIQIMERGNNYFVFNFKGLELQETSCHTLEALHLDTLLDIAFDRIADDKQSPHTVNPYIKNLLTPLCYLDILTYSDAKSCLTGIIDNPDTLDLISRNFIKTFLWLVMDFTVKKNSKLKTRDLPIYNMKVESPENLGDEIRAKSNDVTINEDDFENLALDSDNESVDIEYLNAELFYDKTPKGSKIHRGSDSGHPISLVSERSWTSESDPLEVNVNLKRKSPLPPIRMSDRSDGLALSPFSQELFEIKNPKGVESTVLGGFTTVCQQKTNVTLPGKLLTYE